MSAIKPSNIKAGQRIRGAFGGDRDKEEAASWVVKFCQGPNGDTWRPFALDAIDAFHAEHVQRGFDFGGLAIAGFVIVGGRQCRVTDEFIRRCYRASPA